MSPLVLAVGSQLVSALAGFCAAIGAATAAPRAKPATSVFTKAFIKDLPDLLKKGVGKVPVIYRPAFFVPPDRPVGPMGARCLLPSPAQRRAGRGLRWCEYSRLQSEGHNCHGHACERGRPRALRSPFPGLSRYARRFSPPPCRTDGGGIPPSKTGRRPVFRAPRRNRSNWQAGRRS